MNDEQKNLVFVFNFNTYKKPLNFINGEVFYFARFPFLNLFIPRQKSIYK